MTVQPTLHRYQSYRIRGNGRIRTALVIIALVASFFIGAAQSAPNTPNLYERDAKIVAGYFYDPTQ